MLNKNNYFCFNQDTKRALTQCCICSTKCLTSNGLRCEHGHVTCRDCVLAVVEHANDNLVVCQFQNQIRVEARVEFQLCGCTYSETDLMNLAVSIFCFIFVLF